MLSYNNGKFISECLESVENQSFDDYEIIIVDDASIDCSKQIIIDFVEKSKNAVVAHILKMNLGVVSNYNVGLKLARGRYIAHIASDDVNKLNRISLEHAAITKSNASMVISGVELINDVGNLIKRGVPSRKDQELERVLSSGIVKATSPTMLYNIELIKKYGPLPEDLANEDEALAFRAIVNNGIVILSDYLVLYRKHSTSITHGHEKKNIRKYLEWLGNDIIFRIENKHHWGELVELEFGSLSNQTLAVIELISRLEQDRRRIDVLLCNKYDFILMLKLLLSVYGRCLLLEYYKQRFREHIYVIFQKWNSTKAFIKAIFS